MIIHRCNVWSITFCQFVDDRPHSRKEMDVLTILIADCIMIGTKVEG